METWLPSLLTNSPEERFGHAVKLARIAVKKTRSHDDVRTALTRQYALAPES